MSRNQTSFVLEQAILYAIQNPPQPIIGKPRPQLIEGETISEEEEVTQPVDFLAYHDAIQLLHDEFAKHQGVITPLAEKELITQAHLDAQPTCIYSFNQAGEIDNNPDHELTIANHERIILTRHIEKDDFKRSVGRVFGTNNQNKNIDNFFKGKDGILIQPYEMTTIVKSRLLGGYPADKAYQENPFHPCFTHLVSPAPVMGIALESNVKQLIGYVAHAKMLYNLLSAADMASIGNEPFKLKHHMGLQYDTQTALRLLNYRYNVDIDKTTLDRITEFDKQLERYSKGACCIEFPNF
ncbi:hypothetical protein [Psychrobacter sp. AOP31-A1-22]|uniref:hypothetical protein n=1 Tax=Psychrobacter sp. AOP31-A1-22 TaxID=3457696 RepID=UPI0040356D98